MKTFSMGRWSLVLGVVMAAWFLSFGVWPELYCLVGTTHYGVWFLDTFAILASSDAVARGLDPYVPNPLDYFARPHVYTHWWLRLHDLGLTRASNFWVGLTVVAAFFLTAVAGLRPRSWRELIWFGAMLGSPPVLLAVNRANNDLVIFVLLAPVVPCLLDGRRLVRMAAIVLIAVAAGLKFFPASAGLILLKGAGVAVREVRERLILAVAALALVGYDLAGDIAGIGKLAPKAFGLLTFAATNLPAEMGVSRGYCSAMGLVLAAGIVVGFWRSRCFEGWVISRGETGPWLSFVLGAVVLTGCFLMGTNFSYRWVFALWLAPLLWNLRNDAAAPQSVRRLGAWTAGLLGVSLWADGLVSAILGGVQGVIGLTQAEKIARVFFAIEQPVTWTFFACLIGFLTHFTKEGVRNLQGRPTPANTDK